MLSQEIFLSMNIDGNGSQAKCKTAANPLFRGNVANGTCCPIINQTQRNPQIPVVQSSIFQREASRLCYNIITLLYNAASPVVHARTVCASGHSCWLYFQKACCISWHQLDYQSHKGVKHNITKTTGRVIFKSFFFIALEVDI